MAEVMAADETRDGALRRAAARIAALEAQVARQTHALELARDEIRVRGRHFEAILSSLASAIAVTDDKGMIESTAGAIGTLTGRRVEDLIGMNVAELLFDGDDPVQVVDWVAGASGELSLRDTDGREIAVLCSTTRLGGDDAATGGGAGGVVWLATDIRPRRQLEIELRHAQKLESIGSLAAGIAHEINTPIQFVGDSVHFLADGLTDLVELIARYRELREAAAAVPELAPLAASLLDAEDELDAAFIEEETPRAIARTVDGIGRVARIVHAMKEFSHPGGSRALTDLGEVVESALTVSRHEYKLVAELVHERSDTPPVLCDRGDVGQVVLNLVVNATHAIVDRGERTDPAKIVVRTAVVDGGVIISVADNGAGIPDDIRSRIFDPFFTTKETGRGTGQGLALAQRVLDRHGGRISVASEVGVGTTFTCWFPLEPR